MAELRISENANQNYLAKIVELRGVRKHTNADRLQCVTIDGNTVVTGLEAKDGMWYVFFPAECAINKEYLSWSNSYEDKTLNADNTKKGFFNKHGRVRVIKLRGEKSEGYIVPVKDIQDWLVVKTGDNFSNFIAGTEFDFYGDIEMCKKYIPPSNMRSTTNKPPKGGKVARLSKLIDNQFRFHGDTAHLAKNIHKFSDTDIVSITNKLHGTSFVVSNVLCRKPLKWYEKVLKWMGVNITDTHYDLVYSSRKVVKNKYLNPQGTSNHYYSYDLWEDIAKYLEPNLTEGLTFYGEAVGFTRTGGYIQKGYDYGCVPPQPMRDDYMAAHDMDSQWHYNEGEHYAVYIYRITYTNHSGKVFEFSWQQVKDYCNKFGLKHVPEFYYGSVWDFVVKYGKPTNKNVPLEASFPDRTELVVNGTEFGKELAENNTGLNFCDVVDCASEPQSTEFIDAVTEMYLEKDCTICKLNIVPAEGVVVRKEVMDFDAYKHKSFRFKERETKMLDEGEVDLETQESEVLIT